MNYMEEVAKLLSVEFEEVFMLRVNKALEGHPHLKDKEYKLTPEGLFVAMGSNERIGYTKATNSLTQILNGQYEIVKLPWKPKTGERYYYCTLNFTTNLVKSANFEPHYLEDAYNIKVGNCFPTKGEAEQHLTAFKEWIKSEPITDWRDSDEEDS